MNKDTRHRIHTGRMSRSDQNRRPRSNATSRAVQGRKNLLGRIHRLDLTAYAILITIVLWWSLDRLCGDLRYFGYINAFGVWWGLVAALTGVFLAFRRRIVAAVLAFIMTGTIVHEGMAFNFHPANVLNKPHFRVVTASLRTENLDMASAAATLTSLHSDVLVLQEASNVAGLMSLLDRDSHAHWNYVNNGNEIIACRCSVSGRSVRDYLLSADVLLSGGTVRVWNVRAPKYYADPSENIAYFNALSNQLRVSSSAIVAGDFNATPWNDGYRMIAALGRDAWRRGGIGPGFTFSASARRMGTIMPLISIDHVFLRGAIHTVDARVGAATNGTDHYPVVVDLVAG